MGRNALADSILHDADAFIQGVLEDIEYAREHHGTDIRHVGSSTHSRTVKVQRAALVGKSWHDIRAMFGNVQAFRMFGPPNNAYCAECGKNTHPRDTLRVFMVTDDNQLLWTGEHI